MNRNNDWIWDIISCPECGSLFNIGNNGQETFCLNSTCNYHLTYNGRVFNLLPLALDAHQKAENKFRVNLAQGKAENLQLFNFLTSYWTTSNYRFFREHFSNRYDVCGRGLEIGGAKGQASGFLKLFYPDIEIITSDVAPYNIVMAEKFSQSIGFGIDYFVMADAERLPFLKNSFDFIFSSGMLHHLGDLERALKQGYSRLKPKGLWYIINELSIGTIPRLYWNSKWGEKGRQALRTGINENSYTLKEWTHYFEAAGFRIVETNFHRNPNHKLRDWSRAFYYAVISKLPVGLIRLGIPCEVGFVLEKL